MNFKTALDRTYTTGEIFSLMRVLNGLSFLLYYSFVLIPHYEVFFSTKGYVVPDEFSIFPGSWLFSIWPHDGLKLALFSVTILLFIFYTIGFYARPAQLLLLPLQLAFHNASPLINHEPQQLNNLLLLVLTFAPIEENFYLKKFRLPAFMDKVPGKPEIRILLLMQIYFGLYYFFAGVKKLPDPNWINGSAVAKLSAWEFLGRGGVVNEICQNRFVSAFLTWFTLIYEMSFLAVSFTRFRTYLIPLGMLFHLGISLTLDIGMFFWSMMMWYPLCLKREN